MDLPSTHVALSELWNGSSWTEVNDLNTARYSAAAAGTSTSAIFFGGLNTANSASTESWNGTNWTNENDISTARYQLSGLGTSSLALASGGAPGATAVSEEWNGDGITTQTID